LRLFSLLTLVGFVFALAVQPAFAADVSKAELESLFPHEVGGFKRTRAPLPVETSTYTFSQGVSSAEYSGGNQRFLVELIKLHQDTEAYSLLSVVASLAREKDSSIQLANDFGTASFVQGNQLTFFKGVEFVRITVLGKAASTTRDAFARAFAETIDKGENDIPALLKHLPNPEQSQKTAIFLTRFTGLQSLLPGQAVLSAVEAEGNADAAFVTTDSGKMLVVEFNTPQLAKENDDRIVAKIQELWKLGQPAPTAYKRVGNYSVFVFDAADNATAKKLIEQVKYEQVVQWLGDNPYIFKEAEKRYVETTLGVFVAVVKASGVALLACLGLGGLIGALLFTRRRAQQKTQEAYSDAGGMLRLNLDDLSAPQTDPARLLGPGN